jgi:archaellum biogenesis protein FlaJ (TadC family)
MFVLCILFVFVLFIVSNVYSCPFLVVLSVFYVCVVYFVLFVFVLCIGCKHWIQYTERRQTKQNTQHKHRKLTGQPGMGSCKHWIQYTERRQTKQNTQHKHRKLLCILIVFVLCIVSNVYSCPFLVVPSVFYVCVMYFVCFRSVYCIQCLQQTKYTTQTYKTDGTTRNGQL